MQTIYIVPSKKTAINLIENGKIVFVYEKLGNKITIRKAVSGKRETHELSETSEMREYFKGIRQKDLYKKIIEILLEKLQKKL